MTLEDMIEAVPSALLADGLDQAIMGIDSVDNRVIYNINVVIDILMKQDMDFDEAMEYFEFNIQGAFVGEKTPIWCWPVHV
jgi:hypothetical protein